jgi:hypothetical protein
MLQTAEVDEHWLLSISLMAFKAEGAPHEHRAGMLFLHHNMHVQDV